MIRAIHRLLLSITVMLLGQQIVNAAEPTYSVTTGSDKLGRWCDLQLGSATMRLRELPAGTFWMGSPETEVGRYSDESRHQVTLSRSFAIGQFEVTQAEWKAAMGSLPKVYSGTIKGPSRGPDEEVDNNERATKVVQPKDVISTKGDVPIVFVSWEDCQAFCNRVNAGLTGWRVRLSTEAEWEYACRAGTETAFNNGRSVKSPRAEDKNLDPLAWYQEGGDRTLKPVGRKQPNAWGLFDMHGNASEWCADYLGPYDDRPVTDPRGPDRGEFRVIRGGSIDLNSEDCRSAWRMGRDANEQHKAIGFRLVLQRSEP
jgi:formylglycine-generating enzyme required for sulfatase activity